MTQKHLELMCLATSYLDMYLNEYDGKDKEVRELYEFIRVEVYNQHRKSLSSVIKNTELICSKLNMATLGKDVEANILTMAIASLMVLRDDNVFRLSKSMKLNRLVNSLYNKLELSLQGTTEFKNSMKLIIKVSEL